METNLNFGELGNVNFQSEDNIKYIATYLGWVPTTEQVVQVKYEKAPVLGKDGELVFNEDGTAKTYIPTAPEIRQVDNEENARDFIIRNFKGILTDIPVKAFMLKRKLERDAEDRIYEEEIKNGVNNSII